MLDVEHWTEEKESVLIIIIILISLCILFQVDEGDNNKSKKSETGMFIQQCNKHDRFGFSLYYTARVKVSMLIETSTNSNILPGQVLRHVSSHIVSISIGESVSHNEYSF